MLEIAEKIVERQEAKFDPTTVGDRHEDALCELVARNPRRFAGVVSATVSNQPKGPEVCMKADLSPTEARSGVVSGRVITVLIISLLGAMAALGVTWVIIHFAS